MNNKFFVKIACLFLVVFCFVGIFLFRGERKVYALTQEDGVYLISSKQDLEEFRDLVNANENGGISTNAKLTCDIDLEGTEENQWVPIGPGTIAQGSDCYSGTFDGNGYTISGLYINNTSTSLYNMGLFGGISSATIKDLTVRGTVISKSYNTAGIVGLINGSALIERCHNEVNVSVTDDTTEGFFVGGIVGNIEDNGDPIVRNCLNSGKIMGKEDTGGIAGAVNAGTISKCVNVGYVRKNDGTSVQASDAIGGIVGYMSVDAVEKCYYRDTYSSYSIGQNANSEAKYEVDGITKKCYVASMHLASSYSTFEFDFDNEWMQWPNHIIPKRSYTFEGEGTAINPYLIKSRSDLVRMPLYNTNNTYYALANDIDLAGDKIDPIFSGQNNGYFAGKFDGRGHTISGINIDSRDDYTSFFGGLSGTIKNLTIAGSITGAQYAAGFVGKSEGVIYNVVNNATVSGSSYVGGIVAYQMGSTSCIEFAVNNGNITSTSNYVGGIAGYLSNGKVRSSTNNATVTNMTTTSTNSCGGIVGTVVIGNCVYNCLNTGEIVTNVCYTGGIVGSVSSSSSPVNYCVNMGTITTSSSNQGAIIGRNTGNGFYPMQGCYYLTGTAPEPGCGVGSGFNVRTAEQFKAQSNFSNLNFNYVWEMSENNPVLMSFEDTANGWVNAKGISAESYDAVTNWNSLKNSTFSNSIEYRSFIDYFGLYEHVGSSAVLGEDEHVKKFIQKYDAAIQTGAVEQSNDFLKRITNGVLEPFPPEVAAVVALIDEIGVVSYTQASNDKIVAAREAYDALDVDKKTLVINYETLINAEQRYADLGVVSGFVTVLDLIGDVSYTQESKGKIDAAVEAYNALTENQKALVDPDDLAELNLAVDTYAALGVDTLINALGETSSLVYPTSGEAIVAAREAYDDLTAAQQTLVQELTKLEAFEEAYSNLEDLYKASHVDDLIDAIGEVEYTQASNDKIVAAREAYDDLTSTQKGLVINYDDLVVAVDKYIGLSVAALIDAIGEVEYTQASNDKIVAAREAYDDLEATQKSFVTNYETLTNAEQRYADLGVVSGFVAVLDLIGDVSYTQESKDKIDAARNAYNALTEAQKALVSADDLAKLNLAENKYTALGVEVLIDAIGEVEYTQASKDKIDAAILVYVTLSGEQKELINPEKYANLVTSYNKYYALGVEALINAIGEVEYTQESKDKIDAARAAYDDFSADVQALVTNLEDLEDAEYEYPILETIALIDLIGTVDASQETKEKIDAAVDAYDALTDAQKDEVTNEDKLTDALFNYPVMDTIAKIKAIGTVDASQASKDKIDAAKDAYNSLTDEQKPYVLPSNVVILDRALNTYAALNTIALIDAIGEVEHTDASKDKIDAAKDAFDALTDAQKDAVTNKDALTDAIDSYVVLGVVELINEIGEVAPTAECKNKIDAAVDAYYELTTTQKALIDSNTYKKLTDADKDYQTKNVEQLISNIGTIAYTDNCKNKIDAAVDAYNELPVEYRQSVNNYSVLENAVEQYPVVKVVSLIDAIGEVKYSDSCKEKINAAREAYDALPSESKSKVTNKNLLDESVEKYDELKEENKHEVKIKLIIFGSSLLACFLLTAIIVFIFDRKNAKKEKKLAAK